MNVTLLGLAIVLVMAASGAAQEDEPTAQMDTYCLTLDIPAGTSVDESTILADVSVLTVVAMEPCGRTDGDGSTVASPGTTVTVGRWDVSIEGFNNSAWRRIKQENMFNDAPPRGQRLVMVTVRVGHDERGTSYDPAFDIDTSLFGPDDAMQEYSGVTPGNSLFGLDGIPGGRSKTFTEVFVVPNRVKASDLVLYVESDGEYAEIALAG